MALLIIFKILQRNSEFQITEYTVENAVKHGTFLFPL